MSAMSKNARFTKPFWGSIFVSFWALGLQGCTGFDGFGSQPNTSVTGEYLAGRLAVRQNDFNTAAQQFDRVQPVVPGSLSIREDAFHAHLLNGDFNKAAEIANHLARFSTNERSVLVTLTLAVDDLRSRRYASARSELFNINNSAAFEAGAFLLKAWAIDGDKGSLAAIKHLKNPPEEIYTGFTPLHLAFLYEKSGLQKEAMESYQLAFLTLGGSVGQRAFLEFLARDGDREVAIEADKLLLRRRGYTRRLGLRNLDDLETGKVSYEFAKLTPQQGGAVAIYMLGNAMVEQIYEQRNAAREAGFTLRDPALNDPIAMMQLALALDPNLVEARNFLGTLNNIHRQYDAAIKAQSKIPASSVYYEQAQIEIAGAYFNQDDMPKAIAVLESVVNSDEGADEARLVLASSYASEDRFEEAKLLMDKTISSREGNFYADDWRFFVARGEYLIALDLWEQAEEDLVKAVEISPEEPTALNYLGYSWAERGVNLEEAFSLLEKALAKNPQSGAIIDSVAWAHYQLGQYDEAVTKLEQAVALVPEDPTITDHLGDVYWRLDRQIEARYEWRRALELEPDNKLKVALEDKLENGLAAESSDDKETIKSTSE